MRVLQIGATLVSCYLAVVVLAWVFQRRLIYLPLDHRVPPVGGVFQGGEEVSLRTADGLELGGWWIPAREGPSAGVVIFCNGNAGNRSYRAALASALAGHGIDVLLFDYRGYGGNPGTPSEAGLAEDLRAAVRHVVEERGVPRDRVVYFGESLGAAVAVGVAVADPPAGLILRSPFASMVAVGRSHYPFLPVGALLQDRYPSLDRVPEIHCPLLVLAGDQDQIVPAEQSLELYRAAASSDKKWVLFRGVDHNSEVFLAGAAMLDEVVPFVRRVTGGPP